MFLKENALEACDTYGVVSVSLPDVFMGALTAR